jgi:predicted alpha/beta superfamily hydrolase
MEAYLTNWQIYMEGKDSSLHSVIGAVRVAQAVYSPQLDNSRDILVYLPPSYHADSRAYPVLYMHDGQNLFDKATSYVGEWQVDETMERLAKEGIEAIVVGIPNTGGDRISEYSPYETRWGKGKGDNYLSFIADTVKPMVDGSFRTLPQREHTGIAGSSMGGLISMYGFLRRPDIFGFAGVMSPSFWITGGKLLDYAASLPAYPGKVYLDIGIKEISWRRGATKTFTNAVKQMYGTLVSKGYIPEEQVKYVEDPEGVHHESSWTKRLPEMLRFLLAGQTERA